MSNEEPGNKAKIQQLQVLWGSRNDYENLIICAVLLWMCQGRRRQPKFGGGGQNVLPGHFCMEKNCNPME